MGREIREVKRGWEHPKDYYGKYHPLFDKYYGDELNEWNTENQLWNEGKHPVQLRIGNIAKKYKFFAEWEGNPPDINYYRKEKWIDTDEMWFQLYETISEGTPLSPAFPSKQALAEYLIKNGDYWGYLWTKEQAYSMIETNWCPSGITLNGRFYGANKVLDVMGDNHE